MKFGMKDFFLVISIAGVVTISSHFLKFNSGLVLIILGCLLMVKGGYEKWLKKKRIKNKN